MKKIIVVSAHPDDEILGLGGTLLKHKQEGDEINWIIVTKVDEINGFSKERVISRDKEINTIVEKLGIKNIFRLDYNTMSLSSNSLIKLIPEISDIFNIVRPETVYVMNRSDIHSDHRITFDAVLSCTKSFRYPFIKTILMYECISETEFAPALAEKVFMPNYFVDISDFLEEKINLMKIYNSEMGKHPFPRSSKNIKALATFRGATCGVIYAEAFQLLKFIDK